MKLVTAFRAASILLVIFCVMHTAGGMLAQASLGAASDTVFDAMKRVHFTFPACAKSGRTVLDLRDVHKAYSGHVVFDRINAHIERGDRIALIGPNGAGKSTLMRMLSGVEAPDSGSRTEGHQVITQYFAQDEATRLDPTLTVYHTLAGDAPIHMVPNIRNILGGFLFSGDDVEKPVRVLSGGERTRLAVARMLLRPSNTLLLDEPPNHLDLDSKDVLLEALEDFGGTLIFVSHDRYFVDKLATKVISIGRGEALVYPGNYEEFLWSQKNKAAETVSSVVSAPKARRVERTRTAAEPPGVPPKPAAPAESLKTAEPPPKPGAPRLVRPSGHVSAPKKDGAPGPQPQSAEPTDGSAPAGPLAYEDRKRQEAEARKARKALDARRKRIDDLESRIAEREQAIKDIEATMAAPGFYENHDEAKPIIDRHQALMWEVGDLMHQWEELQQTDL